MSDPHLVDTQSIMVLIHKYRKAQIPTGRWQFIAGIVFAVLALLCWIAASGADAQGEPSGGAAAFGGFCAFLAGACFFWALILRYFSILELKIDRLICGLADGGAIPDLPAFPQAPAGVPRAGGLPVAGAPAGPPADPAADA